MRSCLVLLGILVLAIFLLLWFAVPAVAGVLALNALRAAGLSGTDIQVTVQADPPPYLLLGHADTVRLTCTDASLNDLHAGSADITLSNVSLFSRQVETVDGKLGDVVVTTPDGTTASFSSVSISGQASQASATLVLPMAEAQQLAEERFSAVTGTSATVTFQSPDGVTILAAGHRETGKLVVRNGTLFLRPDSGPLPEIALITPGAGNPFNLTAVEVQSDGLLVSGTMDVNALLQGG